MSKHATSNDSVFTMSIDELTRRVEKAKEHFAAIAELLPGLLTLTEEDRRHMGKLRDGEPDALDAVLEVADAFPAFFTTLADKDGGVDPKTFETEMLRDHLARREILGELATALQAVTQPVADTVLALGEQVRPVLLAAYHIAKPIAAGNDDLRGKLAPALDFYGRIGRRSAETRAKKPPAAGN